MKKKITKTVAVISAIAVALGVILCAAGAAQNGRFSKYERFDYGDQGGEYLYPNSGDSYDEFFDDFFGDFFGDDTNGFYDDFNMYGGGNDEASL